MRKSQYKYKKGICPACQKEFTALHDYHGRKQIYCNEKCYGQSLRKIRYCLQCKKELQYNRKRRITNKMFCSKKCSDESKIGKKLTLEHRQKLSIAKRGKPIHHFINNKEEIRKKISKSLTGKPQPWNRGKNHHAYKDGGKAKWARQKAMGRFEYKNWRRSVYERDNYTCQSCGKKGGKLIADHILPYSLFPKLRLDISNGKTLCRECNMKTPTYGGNIKKYRKDLINILRIRQIVGDWKVVELLTKLHKEDIQLKAA